MKVTEVQFYPVNRLRDTHPVAACSVVFDGVFKVHNIKIFEGGVVTMPQRQVRAEGYTDTNRSSRDVCHPIDTEFFHHIRDMVLEGYALYSMDSTRNCYTPVGV